MLKLLASLVSVQKPKAIMDFTWNSTRNTITRWLKIFFYNTIYSKSISISWNMGVDEIVVHTRKPLGGTGEEVYNSLVNGNAEVKLGDLGSARRVGERVTQYTSQYCSIDQVKAMIVGRADPSMDVFSFGASLYTALTRRSFNPQSWLS
ncbi:hypothetical protein BFU36_13165 [Sulfolobus sp. A20]|nr:hypothetical protein BFU36_13165 [Sulfolobus sp. A20]TRM75448.1 hypothetical protein DJ532_10200 [Sulfolobus sp. A20-N-F8]TRM82933.1 hypothetical protein DJ531_07665 [Sulfolobus sp. A20-N-F6]TRM88195.1 hypothetical protein DJ529_05975 [Sulfolobus sp. C3]TRM94613.1 hypothetical protein DJ526_02060 [Sulfolobus sp. A20-N-G8]TRM96860.1 hypothetical protein DMP16_04835 [Sulfolobus sp. B1]TRN02663.1 hypothetical protein DJ527_03275 [Sulfolobus sp. F1]